jgi:hypothetical protein
MADLDTTRFGAVIDWLLDNLPTLVDVPLFEGWADAAESVIIGRTTIIQDWQAIGARHRSEDTVTDILIYVSIEGSESATEVRRRAIEIANTVGTVLRTDQTAISLGGICSHSSVRVTDWTPGITPDGRDGLLQLELATFNTRF